MGKRCIACETVHPEIDTSNPWFILRIRTVPRCSFQLGKDGTSRRTTRWQWQMDPPLNQLPFMGMKWYIITIHSYHWFMGYPYRWCIGTHTDKPNLVFALTACPMAVLSTVFDNSSPVLTLYITMNNPRSITQSPEIGHARSIIGYLRAKSIIGCSGLTLRLF